MAHITADKIKILRAYPHRWGPGKVHAWLRREERTDCGLQPHGELTEGKWSDVTCEKCLAK